MIRPSRQPDEASFGPNRRDLFKVGGLVVPASLLAGHGALGVMTLLASSCKSSSHQKNLPISVPPPQNSMPQYLVFSLAHVESFDVVPEATPDAAEPTGPPLPVADGALNSIVSALSGLMFVGAALDREDAVSKFVELANEQAAGSLSVQERGGAETHQLFLSHNQSRPGVGWYPPGNLHYLHATLPRETSAGIRPGVPFEPRDGGSLQLLAPIAILEVSNGSNLG